MLAIILTVAVIVAVVAVVIESERSSERVADQNIRRMYKAADRDHRYHHGCSITEGWAKK